MLVIVELIHCDLRAINRRAASLPFPMGITVTKQRFNVFTLNRIGEPWEESYPRGTIIHIALSRDFPGYCWQQELDEKTGFFTCKCPEYTKVGFCLHVKELHTPVTR